MTLKAAKKGHAEIVRFCLERGVKPDYDVIIEAFEFPEVFKVLVTVGGLDINWDFQTAGDMLINAVWELKVRFHFENQIIVMKKSHFLSLLPA